MRNRLTREAQIAQMFKHGSSMREIGSCFGISRQRVQRILAAQGLGREDGGFYKVAHTKQAERRRTIRQRKEKRCLAKYGLSLEEYEYFRSFHSDFNHTPLGQFLVQKSNAAYRGIEWNLTFKQWWGIWGSNGYYWNRGANGSQYVMARYGDSGAYEIGNVRILTCADNGRERQGITIV